MDKITELFCHKYMAAELSVDLDKGRMYNPERLQPLSEVKALTEKMRGIVEEHMMMPTRPQTVGWRLLLRHTEFCEGLAEALMEKCQGHDEVAAEMLETFFKSFGRHDYELERWFDFGLCANALKRQFKLERAVVEL